MKKIIYILLGLFIIFTACEKDDEDVQPQFKFDLTSDEGGELVTASNDVYSQGITSFSSQSRGDTILTTIEVDASEVWRGTITIFKVFLYEAEVNPDGEKGYLLVQDSTYKAVWNQRIVATFEQVVVDKSIALVVMEVEYTTPLDEDINVKWGTQPTDPNDPNPTSDLHHWAINFPTEAEAHDQLNLTLSARDSDDDELVTYSSTVFLEIDKDEGGSWVNADPTYYTFGDDVFSSTNYDGVINMSSSTKYINPFVTFVEPGDYRLRFIPENNSAITGTVIIHIDPRDF